jgi:hypothetical protein
MIGWLRRRKTCGIGVNVNVSLVRMQLLLWAVTHTRSLPRLFFFFFYFHNASPLHGARVHAISFTPPRKVRPPLRGFSRNSQNARQHYVKVSYTDFHTYGIINVEIKERSSFMPLSMAVTVIRKLTTAHRNYVKIPDTESYRNRSQEMWKLG